VPIKGLSALEQCTKPEAIAENFMQYFSKICTPNSDSRATSLCKEYMLQRQNYFEFPFAADDIIFDTELVSKDDLKGGKAPDLAGLTAEHLCNVHTLFCQLF